jgi:ADP-heptose:LPS heptosyltransferase
MRLKMLYINHYITGMGDAILEFSFLQWFRKEINSDIYITTKLPLSTKAARFLKAFIPEEKFFFLDLRGIKSKGLAGSISSVPRILTYFLTLLKHRWTIILNGDLGGSDIELFLMGFLRAPFKVALDYRGKHKSFKKVKVVNGSRRVWRPFNLAKMAEALPFHFSGKPGRTDLSSLLTIPPSPHLIPFLESGEKIITVFPFVDNHPFLRAPVSRWNFLIKEILKKDKNTKILIIGQTKDLKEWSSVLDVEGVYNLVGMTTLSDICHLINRCDVFIGHDGGLSHIAWALNKPRVILYRYPYPYQEQSPWFNYYPEETLKLFLPQAACFPCGHASAVQCPVKLCRDSFQWDEILSAIEMFAGWNK